MTGTSDDFLFEWLYGQIGAIGNRNPERSYWKLARKLFTTEFIWLVPNDDNRVEDGLELRHEFLDWSVDTLGFDHIVRGEPDPEWLSLPCSMLEMLIALARRASFEADDKTPVDWFWLFMQNLDFAGFNDKVYDSRIDRLVGEKLETFIYRNYMPDGTGGIFPLIHVTQDQRKVELWYQMAAYLNERMPL